MVVAQLVRASDCGSEGCRFESGLPPQNRRLKVGSRWVPSDTSYWGWLFSESREHSVEVAEGF